MISTDMPPQPPDLTPAPIVFHEATEIDARWRSAKPVALGDGGFDRYVLVEVDGLPRLRLELRGSQRPEHWSFVDAIGWKGHIAVGFAERVYLLDPSGTKPNCIELEACFDGFRPEGDRLLVVSGQDITCLDDHWSVVWRSETLGFDGVVIDDVQNGVISGDGEWDPPGGWQPFVISLSDGTRVEQRGPGQSPI